MKIHPDGTVEGSPAELSEYLRLKGAASADDVAPKTVPIGTWQPRPWIHDPHRTWDYGQCCSGAIYGSPYRAMYGNGKPHGSGTQA